MFNNRSYRKAIIVVIMLLMVIFSNTKPIMAVNDVEEPNSGWTSNDVAGKDIGKSANNIWATIVLVLEVVSVTLFLITGIRYMFASADQKADLKKSMFATVLGVILVFGTTYVVKFFMTVSSEIFKR